MGRQTSTKAGEPATQRPKRKGTNAHVFRYLQTRNPSKLEENDLKRALEASLEECPDFWPEDSASCSSSDQGGQVASSSSCSSSSSTCSSNSSLSRRNQTKANSRRRLNNHLKSSRYSFMQPPNHQHANPLTATATQNCCPLSSVHNRYKPVAKKNIYNEADFFHDGIMQYIEYQLTLAHQQKRR